MTNKATKQITVPEVVTVEQATATLAGFECQKNELLDRQTKLAGRRREVAFDAHNGDVGSSKLLDGLHREAAELESRITSIDDAIGEAARRLEAAKRHEIHRFHMA